jgi:hypothetical protein
MVERITCEVMYLVHEFRDVRDVFNLKFDGDAYINFKTEEFRRHMRVLNYGPNIDDIKVVLENMLIKTNIDFELMQSEYVERLHEWLKIVTTSAEDSIGQIFNEKCLRISTA